jgi:hypothetical protein
MRDEASQDRLLSHKPVRVVSSELLEESSINQPRLPDDEDSVEIDFLNGVTPIAKPRDGIYISESRMNPDLKQEIAAHRLMKNNYIMEQQQ